MASKVITSEAYQLIKQDVIKWGRNFLIFSAPALLVGLVAFKGGNVEIAFTAFLWAFYGGVVDLLKKFVEQNSYKQ